MRFTWSDAKRESNLKRHGIDFVDAPEIFAGATFTYEDDRFAYAEQRWVTLGLLKDTVVSVVHTESSIQIRIISIRKATRYEEALFFENFPD
jgi:uncharacterized DUF497 family protein